LTEILITFPRFTQERQPDRFRDVLMREPYRRCETGAEARDADLGSDVSPDVVSLCRGMETGGPIDTVMIEERHCRHPYLDSLLH
jgi:hypothetical protein